MVSAIRIKTSLALITMLLLAACLTPSNRGKSPRSGPLADKSSTGEFKEGELEQDSMGFRLTVDEKKYDSIVILFCENKVCQAEVSPTHFIDFEGTDNKPVDFLACNREKKTCTEIAQDIKLQNTENSPKTVRQSLPMGWYAAYNQMLTDIHHQLQAVERKKQQCKAEGKKTSEQNQVILKLVEMNAKLPLQSFISKNTPPFFHSQPQEQEGLQLAENASSSDLNRISNFWTPDYPIELKVGYVIDPELDAAGRWENFRRYQNKGDPRNLYTSIFNEDWVFHHSILKAAEIHSSKKDPTELLYHSFGRYDDIKEYKKATDSSLLEESVVYMRKADYITFMNDYVKGPYSYISRLRINQSWDNVRSAQRNLIDELMKMGKEGFFQRKVLGSKTDVAMVIDKSYVDRIKRVNTTGDPETFAETIGKDTAFKKAINEWLEAGQFESKNSPINTASMTEDEIQRMQGLFYEYQRQFQEYKRNDLYSPVRTAETQAKAEAGEVKLNKMLSEDFPGLYANLEEFIAYHYSDVLREGGFANQTKLDAADPVNKRWATEGDKAMDQRLAAVFGADLKDEAKAQKIAEFRNSLDDYLEGAVDTSNSKTTEAYARRWNAVNFNCAQSTSVCSRQLIGENVGSYQPDQINKNVDDLKSKLVDQRIPEANKYRIAAAIGAFAVGAAVAGGLTYLAIEQMKKDNQLSLAGDANDLMTCLKKPLEQLKMLNTEYEDLIDSQARIHFIHDLLKQPKS